MALIYLLSFYILGILGCLSVALFGRLPVFKGTILESAAKWISGGYLDTILATLEAVLGQRAALACLQCTSYLCASRNPVLPAFYFATVLATFYVYERHIFRLLPTPWTPAWHRWTGGLTVLACAVTWAAAWLSDPGIITAQTHPLWCHVHPPALHLSGEQACPTCRFPRPAKSHHCQLCNRCIARHDHHCGWINNCVGSGNLRAFLAFLVANCVMMAYGAGLAIATLGGHLTQMGLFHRMVYDRKQGKMIPYAHRPVLVLKIVARHYSIVLALAMFLAFGTLLLAAFAGYHTWYISVGVTGSEQRKARGQKAESVRRATLADGLRAVAQRWLEVLCPSLILARAQKECAIR